MKKQQGNASGAGQGTDPRPPRAPEVAAPAPGPSPNGASGFLRWFLSSTVRQANAMRKHVQKILDSQRDILQPNAVQPVSAALTDLRGAVSAGAEKAVLLEKMENLEKVANDWLKPYPNAAWRENIEVLLVALAVAMAIRTFFLQPFKIPTGSMQPTLFGVTSFPDFSHSSQTPVTDGTRVDPPPFFQHL